MSWLDELLYSNPAQLRMPNAGGDVGLQMPGATPELGLQAPANWGATVGSKPDYMRLAGLGQMGMGMMNQQQQQGAMPQSGAVPARERLSMMDWMKRYGLLA